MRVKSLTLHNYRNYEDLSLNFTDRLNVFWGANAQGKTNLVEAIYYAAFGASHRSNQDMELIQWEKETAKVSLIFERMAVENRLDFIFRRDQRRQIVYNGQNIRPKELIGAMNAVLFSPEDLFLIKGAPAGRRNFLDAEISQANPAYYQRLSQYNRAVTQRNALLKKIRERQQKSEILEPWDQQIAVLAADVLFYRLQAVKKLNMLANLMHRKISDNKENLEIGYVIEGQENFIPQDPVLWYNEKLSEVREKDILRGFTGIGPHRDDIVLKVNKINLRSFGSQGQQRTGVLALKLAELEFIKSETGEYPVLLLDDVMSELDKNRRTQLLAFIKERVQTFITATDQAYFPSSQVGKYYQVASGCITE